MQMRQLSVYVRVLAVAFIGLLAARPAAAQTQTWVSGVGSDANPCSRTAPCATFAGALSKTAAGGEIDALDPGAFGTVTITKAITIDGGGQGASVVASSTDGIAVQAGANDVVILRNLRLKSPQTFMGLQGIDVSSAKAVVIQHCDISGFAYAGIRKVVAKSGQQALKIRRPRHIPGAAVLHELGESAARERHHR